jgi:biopolymer transport protein ExbD
MSAWLVRKEGSPEAVSVPSAVDVLIGLRDGNWLPTDEVKGPGDTEWQAIENHPTFAEAALELEPPRVEGPDETTLDMNPLIDVCLVLLIFFILTITYATLERSIEVPPDNPDDKGPKKLKFDDIRDKVFVVQGKMDGERVVVRIEKKEVPVDQIIAEMKQVIEATGRNQMVLDLEKDVPWGVETVILDAAKANGVHEIINNRHR